MHVATSFGDFASCDFVIESVAEKIDVKLSVFTELEQHIRPRGQAPHPRPGLRLPEQQSPAEEHTPAS